MVSALPLQCPCNAFSRKPQKMLSRGILQLSSRLHAGRFFLQMSQHFSDLRRHRKYCVRIIRNTVDSEQRRKRATSAIEGRVASARYRPSVPSRSTRARTRANGCPAWGGSSRARQQSATNWITLATSTANVACLGAPRRRRRRCSSPNRMNLNTVVLLHPSTPATVRAEALGPSSRTAFSSRPESARAMRQAVTLCADNRRSSLFQSSGRPHSMTLFSHESTVTETRQTTLANATRKPPGVCSQRGTEQDHFGRVATLGCHTHQGSPHGLSPPT